jgi:hypothetical protein
VSSLQWSATTRIVPTVEAPRWARRLSTSAAMFAASSCAGMTTSMRRGVVDGGRGNVVAARSEAAAQMPHHATNGATGAPAAIDPSALIGVPGPRAVGLAT